MLRLQIERDPFWIDCPLGVRLQVKPPTTAILEASRAHATKQAREMREARKKIEEAGGSIAGLPDLDDDALAIGLGFELLCAALGRYSIIAWEGVGDDDGNLAPITPENVAALMKVEPVADAFYRRMTRASRALDGEKKSSAPEQSITSEPEPNTAPVAEAGASAAPTT